MSKFICDGEKYEIGGLDNNLDSIGLHMQVTALPAQIEVEGYTLEFKSEFHVTLVATGEIARKHGVTDPGFKDKVTADFCAFVAEHPINFVRYRDEFRFMSQDTRRSVVVMCDVSNLDKFFEFLNKKYNLNLEYPPTHVTLYTLPDKEGIFMTDSDDKETLTKIIPAPVKL